MYARLNGKRIFFDVLNEGLVPAPDGRNVEKPVLFALHGGPGMEHSGMKPFLKPFYDIAQVVTFDQRGSGMSGSVRKNEWSMELLSRDIEKLKNHLGFGKIILMGISFGGMLAMQYALTFPRSLSGLILAVTAPSRKTFDEAAIFASGLKNKQLKETAFKLLNGRLKDDEDLKQTLALATPLYTTKRTPEETMKGLKHINVNSSVLKNFISGRYGKYDLEERLGEINVPTLIMGSRGDWICPLSQSMRMKELIPCSELVIFEKSRHEILCDEKRKYISTVRKFIRKISQQP